MTAFRLLPACLLLIAAPALRAETPADVPNPLKERRSWVADSAKVLTKDEIKDIDEVVIPLEKKTTAEVAVVTVKNLGGDNIDDFANKLFKLWGIGKKDKNNGVLILAALEDRKIRIEVGYGLEDSLTNEKCTWIIKNDIVPDFKEQKYGLGLLKATKSVSKVIDRDK